jgi:hypothetical protein
MSFSNPIYITYSQSVLTTAAAATYKLRGPKGKRGFLIDIVARCHTANHVLGSTPTTLLVGISGDTDKFATFKPAADVINDAQTLTDDPGTSSMENVTIDTDTEVLLTTVANAGGSPTGSLTYDVIIAWA